MGVQADGAMNTITCRGNGSCNGKVRCSGNSCSTDCTGSVGVRDGRVLQRRDLPADAPDPAVPVTSG